jgi:SpoVK/Ycf46/Vps4 family AAA+-type ATPase
VDDYDFSEEEGARGKLNGGSRRSARNSTGKSADLTADMQQQGYYEYASPIHDEDNGRVTRSHSHSRVKSTQGEEEEGEQRDFEMAVSLQAEEDGTHYSLRPRQMTHRRRVLDEYDSIAPQKRRGRHIYLDDDDEDDPEPYVIPEYVPERREGLRTRKRVDYHVLEVAGVRRPPRNGFQASKPQDTRDNTAEDEDDGMRSPYHFRRRGRRKDYRDLLPQDIAPASGPFNAPSRANKHSYGMPERSRRHTHKHTGFGSMPHLSGVHADSDSDNDKVAAGGHRREADLLIPMNVDEMEEGRGIPGLKRKATLADTDPLGVGPKVTFESVGGLDHHIRGLKEMVLLPLVYPELFTAKNVQPPRGVIFHGPPGTGKTLLARALASSCSNTNQKIAFFMRKGADCLSKWVGEAERQLRLLFEAAKLWQPAIIFFDEIDGLAPVRSSRQDQVHASVVSTLLALMDGLDNRGQVVVIGATNRIDAIDPALRRPGRFDREFFFPLPTEGARHKIIDIHTADWQPALSPEFKGQLAAATKGYGGADLKALCTEAALHAIRVKFPQIYTSPYKLLIDPQAVLVQETNFLAAMKDMVPSSHRSVSTAATPLSHQLAVLLREQWDQVQTAVQDIMPRSAWKKQPADEPLISFASVDVSFTFRPRLLIHSAPGMCPSSLSSALLYVLEGCHVCVLDVAALFYDSSRTPEAACIQLFTEAKRHQPSIVYIPRLHLWKDVVTPSILATISNLVHNISFNDPILLLADTECTPADLPVEIARWFVEGGLSAVDVHIAAVDTTHRKQFFCLLKEGILKRPLPPPKKLLEEVVLERAPTPPPRQPTEQEMQMQLKHERTSMAMFRYALSSIMKENKRHNRHLWNVDLQPFSVDTHARINHGDALDLEAIHLKTFRHHAKDGYLCKQEFVDDLQRFSDNVLDLYYPEPPIHEDYAKSLAVIEQARRLMDVIVTDMDQFSDDLWNHVDKLYPRLAKEREERLVEEMRLAEFERMNEQSREAALARLRGHRHSRRLMGETPEPADLIDVEDVQEVKVVMEQPEAVEQELDAMQDVQVSSQTSNESVEVEQTLDIDELDVDDLLHLIADSTSEYTVEELMSLHTNLAALVSKFSTRWERRPLFTAMQATLERSITLKL